MKHSDIFECFFYLGEIMDNKRNKNKNVKKIWRDEHTPYEKRVCGSGVTFTGRYVYEKE